MTKRKTNMYGFTSCPKCSSRCRASFNDKPGIVQCDDCGHTEPATPENSDFLDGYVPPGSCSKCDYLRLPGAPLCVCSRIEEDDGNPL